MIRNLKIALRNLKFNRTYSIINIVGLAVSLAACVFILLWIQDEKSYDRFHKDAENIYTVTAHFKSDGGVQTVDVVNGYFGQVAAQSSGDVTSYCRLLEQKVGYLQVESTKFGSKTMLYADSTFFSFFNFPILKGQTSGLLLAPNDVVISESLAMELFGNTEPVGKMINFEGKENLYVAAVMKDFPQNTSLPNADIISSFTGLAAKTDWISKYYMNALNSWVGGEYLCYLRVKPGTDVDRLAKEVTAQQPTSQTERSFSLIPLVNRHLYTIDNEPAGIKTVHLFQWIAFIILCIACVNYINLVTSQASKRNKEIGLSKILGARRKQLFSKLILEAGILFILAILLAILLNMLLLPGYNQLSGKELSLSWFTGNIWAIYGFMLLFVLIIAGAYPAWLLASFKPVNVIQRKNGGITFRRILVVFQFISSVALIVGTITLEAQMKYMREKNLGYDKEHLLTCELLEMENHFEAVKAELIQNRAILGVTSASDDIMEIRSTRSTDSWEGKEGVGELKYNQLDIDTTFLNTMKITLKEGESIVSNDEKQLIINETAAKIMGMQEPVGKWIGIRGSHAIITGVVKDFHFKSLYEEISPLLISVVPSAGTLYVRTTAKDAHLAVKSIEKLWKQYNPNYLFTYHFVDETFDQMYHSDIRIGRLFGAFSIIAILISCLGLFGLVTYTAETKTKEIGIRKVLGASIFDIMNMLSKEYLILISISMLIAFPLAYHWLNKMLQGFAYRVTIDWWVFALAGVVTLMLAAVTVGWQAIKTATANPVDAIKTE